MVRFLAVLTALLAVAPAAAQQYPGTPPNAVSLSETSGLVANQDIILIYPAVTGWTNFITQVSCSGDGATVAGYALAEFQTGGPVAYVVLFVPASGEGGVDLQRTFGPPLPGKANTPIALVVKAFGEGSTMAACTMIGFRVPNGQLQ